MKIFKNTLSRQGFSPSEDVDQDLFEKKVTGPQKLSVWEG